MVKMNYNLDIPMNEFVFSQSQLARISGSPSVSIFRKLQALKVSENAKEPEKKESGRRKIDITLTRKVLSTYFEEKKSKINRKVHMFYNFKGGTGKTTICYQISTTLSLMGFNVLVIDCDPQAHLTSLFGLPENHTLQTIFDVMIHGIPLEKSIIQVYEGLDLIQSAIPLTKIEIPLAQKMQRENII
jgi:chromosome partitioning protein